MEQLKTIVSTNPAADKRQLPTDQLYQTIKDLAACEAACLACADACLNEEMVAELRECIRLDLACADQCAVTYRALLRTDEHHSWTRSALESCAAACRACAEECARHAQMHEHCRACAEVCRACERTCVEALEMEPVMA